MLNYSTALFLWLAACSIAGLYISSEKNRSPIEGFLLSLLFGPFGLVTAACMPTKGPRPAVPPAVPPQTEPPQPDAPKLKPRPPERPPQPPPAPEESIPQKPGDWGSRMDEDEAMRYLDGR